MKFELELGSRAAQGHMFLALHVYYFRLVPNRLSRPYGPVPTTPCDRLAKLRKLGKPAGQARGVFG